MMLAQGGFAAFLEAKANERAELLEELTGTDIYGPISQNVFEQTRNEKLALDTLLVRADGVQLLTEETELQQQCMSFAAQEPALGKQIEATRAMRAWRLALSEAETQLEQALANQRQADVKIAEAKPSLDYLAASEPAEKLCAQAGAGDGRRMRADVGSPVAQLLRTQPLATARCSGGMCASIVVW